MVKQVGRHSDKIHQHRHHQTIPSILQQFTRRLTIQAPTSFTHMGIPSRGFELPIKTG